MGYSVGLMLMLVVGSVAFMPLALPLLIPGLSADPWAILKPLLITMLIPLAAGMAVKNRAGAGTKRRVASRRAEACEKRLAAEVVVPQVT